MAGHLTVPHTAAEPFAIACGVSLLADHVRRFRFSPAVIQRLGQVADQRGRSAFHESYLNHLQRLRLRVQVAAAPEGTLMLPGEPMIFVQGPKLQVALLQSALRLLVWNTSYWATQAALRQWVAGKFSEEETPHAPVFPNNPAGWRARAEYIGGSDDYQTFTAPGTVTWTWGGLVLCADGQGQPLAQIRRLFNGNQPLGDVWLTAKQDAEASVSHTHIVFRDEVTKTGREVHMARFQNLLQPVLVKGHPVMHPLSLDYLRQRTWKYLEAFAGGSLDGYGVGWYLG